MARLDRIRRRLFFTPAETTAIAEAHAAQALNSVAAERQQLRDSINALVIERTKTAHNVFEVKLVINRAALETCVGEQAALHIAVDVAKRIIERHRLTTKTETITK